MRTLIGKIHFWFLDLVLMTLELTTGFWHYITWLDKMGLHGTALGFRLHQRWFLRLGHLVDDTGKAFSESGSFTDHIHAHYEIFPCVSSSLLYRTSITDIVTSSYGMSNSDSYPETLDSSLLHNNYYLHVSILLRYNLFKLILSLCVNGHLC